jgi:hypothetical protein
MLRACSLTTSICGQRFKPIKKLYEKILDLYYLPIDTRFLSHEFSNLHVITSPLRSASPAHPTLNLTISDEDSDSAILGAKMITHRSWAKKIY